MVTTPGASSLPLNYRAARLRPRMWPAWWALVLFQLGNFATTAAVLSLHDRPSLNEFVRLLPDWLTRAGGNLPIFCWIGHSFGLVFFGFALVGRLERATSPPVSRGPFTCVVAGMLYPLVLAGGVRLCGALSGSRGEGAAIIGLSIAMAVILGLALVRPSPDAG
ncbi:MAG: hypothetical protein WBD40_07450 [Tepidisphaeraceae bacterium]